MKVAAFVLFGGVALVDAFLTGPSSACIALSAVRLLPSGPKRSSSVRPSGTHGEGLTYAFVFGGEGI